MVYSLLFQWDLVLETRRVQFIFVRFRKKEERNRKQIYKERESEKREINSKRESEENHSLLIELKFSAHFDTKLILRIYSNVEKQYC